ncbi:MAG: VCBS repeat-containing protein, partial [Candidatus Zixiibacteriota bacterium]
YVYGNDGDANFTVMDSVESYEMRKIFSADLNGDGFNDLMGASQYFFNNGDGTFYLAFEDTLGGATRDICADDYNGDDIVDIVYAQNYANTGIFILWGLGGGNFSDRDTLVLGDFNSRLVSADFDNDNDIDLLYGNNSGNFTLLNDGNGNFTPLAIDGLAMGDLITTDLNNDGIVDIAGTGTQSCNGIPRYMLGIGNGDFEEIQTAFVITAYIACAIVAEDFNLDGYVDLVICDNDDPTVYCGYNDGLLEFGNQDALPYGYTGGLGMAAGDLNGDGDTDLIVGNADDSLTIVLSLASAHSNRILVPDDLPTIAGAIDYAWNLDTIIVQPGTYSELLNFGGKNLVLASQYMLTGDQSYISATILDGGGAGIILHFENGEDYRSVVNGFTIQNGDGDYPSAINCYDVASPTIVNNIIKNNHCNYSGGAMITGNGGSPLISNNLFIGNSCETWGGAIFVTGNGATIINNTFSGNFAGNDGGAVHFGYGRPVFQNNILWGDSAVSDGNEIAYFGSDPPVITYCNIQGGFAGQGNINTDPLFRDPANNDFHLKAIACGDNADSPCIDAGDPAVSDFLLDCTWGLGAIRSDMGAYGGGEDMTVGIEELPEELPRSISLLQNYPNPFNASTTIRYILNKPSPVIIEIYDLLGRRVDIINQGEMSAGEHQVTYYAEYQSSGIYFYRIQAGDYTDSKKMVLLK